MDEPLDVIAVREPGWARPVVVVPVFVVLAVVGAQFPSFSWRANGYIVAIGAALCWLGISGRLPKRPVPTGLGARAAWWLVPALLLALTELTDFLFGSTVAHPTVSLLLDPLLAGEVGRALGYLAWLGGFWGLIRR